MRNYLASFVKGELSLLDLTLALSRHLWIKLQTHYNFYIEKFKFINRLKGRLLTIVVLSGKYHSLWEVTFERLYAYSGDVDVVVANPDGLHGRLLKKICDAYGFSYFESSSKNFEAVQNYIYTFVVDSPLILKMDDDVFITQRTIPNLMEAFKRLKAEGHDIGFLAPILNVNTVSYFHFLKTMRLDEEYTQRFEKPIFTRNWSKQRIWWDPEAALWVWEHSLPLNMIADIFDKNNKGKVELIPVRFSISCILFERKYIASSLGLLSCRKFPIPAKRAKHRSSLSRLSIPMIPLGDEAYMNFYTNDRMFGRFLVLDDFAGHLCYWPQTEAMLKWFENNKMRLLEDVRR